VPEQRALDPMLAVSKGRLIEMSSPNGKRGHFYENWQEGTEVERIKMTRPFRCIKTVDLQIVASPFRRTPLHSGGCLAG
jgi:hypothetical protein